MANVVSIHLLLSLFDAVATYLVSKEGDDVTLTFNITPDTYVIGKYPLLLYEFGGEYHALFDDIFEERIRYDKTQRTSGERFSFTLLDVSSSDAGLFECESWDIYPTGRYLVPGCSQLLVMSREPTKPEVECDPDLPLIGDHVTLTCISSSRSLPQHHPLVMKYRWSKNGKELETKQADVANITLTVSRDDRGDNYSCQAFEETPPSNPPSYISYEGGLDSPWSSTFILQPQYGPDSIQIYPEQVLEDELATCSADCNPSCHITLGGQAGQVTSGLGQVTFRMDRGQSRSSCTAWNLYGYTSRIVNVTLVFPPAISLETMGEGMRTEHEGESLSFTGIVFSNPEATVTLTSPNGRRVIMTSAKTNDSTYKISYTIGLATCDDHGIFNITAENQFGSDRSSVAVAVLCSPRLDSKPQRVPSSNKNSRSFMIQAYPEPTLEAIFSFSPGGSIQAISPIKAEQDTQDGLMIQRNLHEFIMDFSCESSDGKYLLTFVNSEGKKNISFSLEENICPTKKWTSLTVSIGINISIALGFFVLFVILIVVIRKLVHRSKQRRRRNRRVIYIPRKQRFNHNRNTEVNLDISP